MSSLKQFDLPVYGTTKLGTAIKDALGENIEGYLFELSDHLGNVRAIIQDNYSGSGITYSYADYYPGGFVMSDRQKVASNPYRYGYQGEFAEKDQETGFNQFEARLYDARIMRWMVPDPAGQFWSPYNGMGNNPISGIDPDGREWYHNLFGKQKWFSEKPGFFWRMNSGKGFDYYDENGRVYHNMNLPNVNIKMPSTISDGKGGWKLNPGHPKFNQLKRKQNRRLKYEAQQEAWEGQRGWDTRGKYIIGTAATICSMGAAEVFQVATIFTRIANSASITKNVLNYGDSPILDPNGLESQLPGAVVDATNVVIEIHGMTQGDFSGVVSLPTDVNSLWDNSIELFNESNGE